jgi:acyl-CoA reductase-like NAD-dependent aldehyde dehydrogenase
VLELGGKSANIIFADADIKRAALTAQAAIFAGAGQSCVAGSRLLVQRSIYDEFVGMIATGAKKIKVGAPLDDATEVGPINNRTQYDHIMKMIASGVQAGATLAAGSVERCSGGYFVSPTVLSNVTNEMDVARTEIFGPVVAAIPFDTEEEALNIANDTEFGLAGAVWTNDVGRALRVAGQVNAGTFRVNGYKTINVASPFGGYGLSGYGRSSGVEALYEYTQTKSVWVETAREPATTFGYL